jgi:hypothetical protein
MTMLVCLDFIYHIIFRKENISETESVLGDEKLRRYMFSWICQKGRYSQSLDK